MFTENQTFVGPESSGDEGEDGSGLATKQALKKGHAMANHQRGGQAKVCRSNPRRMARVAQMVQLQSHLPTTWRSGSQVDFEVKDLLSLEAKRWWQMVQA